jgi:signal transduction histidine kinase
LQRLIENYLYYAQLEVTVTDAERRSDLAQNDADPGTVVYEAARERCKAHERERDLVHEVENARIAISSDSLHKLTSELVDNACKFSTAGTPVEVRAAVRDGSYILTIRDHGRGMDAAEIGNIGAYAQFQRNLFEQQGVGLGLAISRRLTELHDGTFNMHSIPGQGTTVEVGLPLAR